MGAIVAKPETGWAVGGQSGRAHEAAFAFARPRQFPAGGRIMVQIDQQHADGKHLLGRFRLSVTDESPPLLRPFQPPKVATLLRRGNAISEQQRAELFRRYLELDARYRDLSRGAAMLEDSRLAAVQDLAWALINSPAFLFNH
ncbi:MAG: hypothetical protein AAF961_01420 [Planctomycetota bacterium]